MSRGPLKVDDAHEAYVESQLIEAAAVLQKAAFILGSPHIQRWFDADLLARAQGDMLQIQVQVLAKLQCLNARSLELLQAPEERGDRGGAE